MLDPVQILLLSVITVLTILMLFIGFHVFRVLRETYLMLKKFNNMVDGVSGLTQNLGSSLKSFNGFSQGVRTALGFLNLVKRKDK